MRQPVPFQGPVVTFEDAMSRRYVRGVVESENRAIIEVLDAPEYRALEDTLDAMQSPFDEDGRRKRGRAASYPVSLALAGITVSLILKLDLRAARHRLYSDDVLRARVGLPPLDASARARLAEMTHGVIEAPGFPAETSFSYFAGGWSERHHEAFFGAVRRMTLRVAADVIHRHSLPTNWVAIDGKRVRATADNPGGARGDEGTAIHTRDSRREAAFAQRHHYPAVLGAVPLVVDHCVTPPKSELVYWVDEGLPSLRAASDELGALITEMRIEDGTQPERAQHPGLLRAAIASDQALASERGVTAIIGNGFHPATVKPERREGTWSRGFYTSLRQGTPVSYEIRSDGAILCPSCSPGRPFHDRRPMTHYAGDFGQDIKVSCSDPTCPGGRARVKIPLRAPDQNDWLPGSSASRGERNPFYISILPTWHDQYVARRFLALQHVEAVHRQFEALFGLGGKNPGVDRRMIAATHRNRVWWAIAGLIWNLTLRMNIDSGRAEIRALPASAKRRGAMSVETVVAGFWAKDGEIRHRRAVAAVARDARIEDEHRRLVKRRGRTDAVQDDRPPAETRSPDASESAVVEAVAA